ncbi:hypothetical protein B5V03_01920 [Bradyrhizobium betae]|uniref:Uncharacterized protein n=1 Tax=Bradyrhizobium betae TaxID=244734 RepID=A0A4Q1VUW8_9BRAD|nr:hypothetical protein B5V03_01920 [Bradyrhizobium betae]
MSMKCRSGAAAEIELVQLVGGIAQFGAGAVIDDLAAPQHIGPVADGERQHCELLDQHHGEPLVRELAHRGHQPPHDGRRNEIVDHCCDAWNKLVEQPCTIMSIGLRDWAYGF